MKIITILLSMLLDDQKPASTEDDEADQDDAKTADK